MKKKYIWITAVIVIVAIIGYLIFGRKKAVTYTVAYTVAKQDVRTTVLATGTVTSQDDLSLGFQNSGTVAAVNVQVSQAVKQGQVLASLDAGAAKAAIAQAQAQVDSAQARWKKCRTASAADIQVAQAAVDAANVAVTNAQSSYAGVVAQQKVAVSNALSAVMNSGLQATPSTSNSSSATASVSGTYTDSAQGSYVVTVQNTGNGTVYSVSGLEQQAATTLISRGVPLALGSKGLFITFSAAGTLQAGDSWTITIPNQLSPSYVSNSNAYQASLQTQSNQVTAAQSQVDSAQAALEQAKASLANTRHHPCQKTLTQRRQRSRRHRRSLSQRRTRTAMTSSWHQLTASSQRSTQKLARRPRLAEMPLTCLTPRACTLSQTFLNRPLQRSSLARQST